MKIVIAEDDVNMQKIIKLYLQKENYDVHTVSNGVEALEYLLNHPVDLLILDWMMPLMDGISVCKEIRRLQLPVKILMVTAKSTTTNEIESLSLGADDYIRKPFDMHVLLLRIKKLCPTTSIIHHSIAIHPTSRTVFQNHLPVELTKKEYDLLYFLFTNKNQVLTRDQILNTVWGIDYSGDGRTVDTHIRRLRKKLHPSYIMTYIGTGYMVVDSDA